MPGQSDKRRAARGRRPAGRSGPGRSPSARVGRSAARPAAPAAASAPTKAETKPRARLTSRAAVLLVIVAVLAVSYASSLRAYLQQRSQIEEVQATIAASEAAIDDLEQEKDRLDDPAYVEQQARARFGFVRPGERPFVVLQDGEPIEAGGTLGDPDSVDTGEDPAWYDDAWGTVLVAGHPPKKADPPPETRVTDPDGAPDE